MENVALIGIALGKHSFSSSLSGQVRKGASA